MIQCVSDSNPYDDEPDAIEEAESWLSQNQFNLKDQEAEEARLWAEAVIQGLLEFCKDELGV